MQKTLFKSTSSKIVLGLAACILVSGCTTTSASHSPDEASRSDKIDSALERAAMSSAASGYKGQNLSYLEKIYKRKSDDPEAALNYAAALREADYLNRAAMVLSPFADDASTPAAMKTEFSAIQLAMGNNVIAEEYAQKAIIQDEKDFRAYHYLGISLDAQGHHKEAERALRKGLDYWEGDPTTIMNNLALNLASQGFLDEASEILLKAQAIAPNRVEIERNLRIITALKQSESVPPPKPKEKPEL